MSNIDQSIIEFFGGYNSFIGGKNDIRLLCDEGKLCFKLGSKKYFNFTNKFLSGLFKIIKININLSLFETMDKGILCELINEAILHLKEGILCVIIKMDTLTNIYSNPLVNSNKSISPYFLESTTQGIKDLKLLKIFEYKNANVLFIDVGKIENSEYRKVYAYFINSLYNGIIKEKNMVYVIEFIADTCGDNFFILPNSDKTKSYLSKNGFDKYAKSFTASILKRNSRMITVFKFIRESLFYQFGSIKAIN